MSEPALELEGTWEEILEHADELEGRRLRVTVLPAPDDVKGEDGLTPKQRQMLAVLDEWERTPLTDEEKRILDEFPEFRRQHPIRFRRLDLDEQQ
ncbi:MAG: hypothetical protein GX774_06815 [Armatimonadetes bacterium]|nr:hypothetical protein [Armatimonadota bacterium]